jgi:hypothetical protein
LLYASRSTGVMISLVSWEYILIFCFVGCGYLVSEKRCSYSFFPNKW